MFLSDYPQEPSLEQLRVPVERALVEVHTDRGRRRAAIFLAPDQAPEDLFEDDAPFFPADEDGTIRLYARASLVSLAVDADDAAAQSLADLGVAYHGRMIAVHFLNGEVLTGRLMSLSGLARTQDLVNQKPRSFAVHTGDKVHHVAKAHVHCIEELP